MKTLSPRVKTLRRAGRWLGAAALVAVMPKCLLCLAAYAGLGAVLGLGGPELCGAPAGPAWPWRVLPAIAGLALGVVRLFLLARTRRSPSCSAIP